MKKFLIIGDSFSITLLDKKYNLNNWPNLLYNNLSTEYEFILDAESGRDPQTMIENYIRYLPNLKEDDIIILFLSSFLRIRLPLDESEYGIVKNNDIEITNRFICPSYYDYTKKKLENINFDWKYISNQLGLQYVINTSTSNIKTTIEVLESLIKLKKTNAFIFSWENIHVKNNIIEDKKILTEKFGFWETLSDLGKINDFHWSEKTHRAFADYLIKKIEMTYDK